LAGVGVGLVSGAGESGFHAAILTR
jgi:hypothetical protein